MSAKKQEVKDVKLFEGSKLKLAALTKSGGECQDALSKLKPLVSYLAKNDPKFVEFMFAPLWEAKFFEKRGDKIFSVYAELLAKLIAIDKSLQERTVQYFASLFLGDKRDDLKNDDQLTKSEQRVFPKIHQFLRKMFATFQKSQSTYLEIILAGFPFTTICTLHQFVCYFNNIAYLYILYESDEENREKILWCLIERLIHIESYLQKEQSNDAKLRRLSEVGLSSIFKFINKVCLRGDLDPNQLNSLQELRTACNPDALRELFDSLASIFIGHLIKMDSPTSVNLVILYVCAMNEQLCVRFLDLLWAEAFDAPHPRPAAVNYFCSFLCTAKYLPLDTLIEHMMRVSKRVNGYLISSISVDDDLENFHKTLKKHKYFYAMCNCLFHLVCVRSQEFTDKHVRQLSQLHVQKIITSPLNPLAVCPIDVVKQFAEICKYYNLALCNMIIQRNRRIGLYDLLKKRDVKFRLVYPFAGLQHSSFDKLSLVYAG